ncbi:phosphoenolpyruvate synthase [soil metagenome]
MILYSFSDTQNRPLAEIGGKAQSLLKGSKAGLPVPPGFILPVQFFSTWIDELKASPEWNAFEHSRSADAVRKSCHDLKEKAMQLVLSDQQKNALEPALNNFSSTNLFAVRSSSPEEDLEGSSFAGGYETILGVTTETMASAINRAFASCLDFRVVVYKREHGFSTNEPKIALVIMQQIASEISGVGFSLNPVTNEYDEAVFNANWGLGETVVGGLVTPDEFIVEKNSRVVKRSEIGSKEFSIWLNPEGGTNERQAYRSNELTLSGEQLGELTALILKVEELYGRPIDIEWAFAEGKLYLLQARPITTWVPLPPDMVTLPGQKRRLYIDMTICVQGIYEPLSVMASSFFQQLVSRVSTTVFNSDFPGDVDQSIVRIDGGRIYANFSNILVLAGKEKFVSFFKNLDPLAAATLEQADAEEYMGNPNLKHLPLHLMWRVPELASRLLAAELMPDHAHRQAQQEIQAFRRDAQVICSEKLTVEQLVDKLCERAVNLAFKQLLPLVIASRLSLQKLKFDVAARDESDLKKLELALPHNVTTEMGLALYAVSRSLPEDLDKAELERRFEDKTLPQEFYLAWESFLDKYGHRGPREIDIASPRYRDNPQFLIDLLFSLRKTTEDESPQAKFDRNQIERHRAFEKLSEEQHSKGWLYAKELQWLYRVVETLAGYRETPKFQIVVAIDLVRRRVIQEAALLVQAKRLERVEQVFDLTLQELDQGIADRSVDLIAKAHANRVFPDQLRTLHQLPAVIDSRGKILRPPPCPVRDGYVSGTPISAGVVQGPVKSLHSPDQKPFEKGDILVARATDPGWTPLFVNAGAVVLEVGGVLQHGALVAREYGLPCVAGVVGATDLWADGTIIEVDGSAGTIRVVPK